MNRKFEHYCNASSVEELNVWLNSLIAQKDKQGNSEVESVNFFQVIEVERSHESEYSPGFKRYDCIALVSYWDDEEKQANREVEKWEAEQKANASRPD